MSMIHLVVGGSPIDLYICEILAGMGLPFERVGRRSIGGPGKYVAVLAGDVGLEAEDRSRLREFVRGGGALLSIGSANGLEELFGVRGITSLGEAWLRPVDPVFADLKSSLHVFGGIAFNLSGGKALFEAADANGEPMGYAGAINRFGKGAAILIGADLPRSIVHIQQGLRIERDGEPAPDGSAPIDDGMLKTEDGLVLDWERDRDELEGVRLFLRPIADELRIIIVKSILRLASLTGLPLPMIWRCPAGARGIGLISHDTDGNDPEKGRRILDVVRDLGLKTTWCVLYPGGYPPGLYGELKRCGMEIGLHFDAMTGDRFRRWSFESLDVQRQWLIDMTGVEPLSNKNHYTRWEGRLEFFRWAEELGLRVDQSKGPSKRGTLGFVFGGSHPWRPIDDEGERPRLMDLIEINLFSQDMIFLGSPQASPFHPAIVGSEVGRALMEETARVGGVAHFLFHPAHIDRPGVREALRELVEHGRSIGLVWMRSDEIWRWERFKREVRQEIEVEGERLIWRIAPPEPSPCDVSLLIPRPAKVLKADAGEMGDETIFGFRFARLTRPLDGPVEIICAI
ncbi:hypothetical protein DRP77_07615 [Candidatus Poribacteria bacterium]|nr:MAG: hypothetical protein DRP77_07615 [Candidatus Poribacteria bacterium]